MPRVVDQPPSPSRSEQPEVDQPHPMRVGRVLGDGNVGRVAQELIQRSLSSGFPCLVMTVGPLLVFAYAVVA